MAMQIAFRKSGVGYTGYKKYTNVVTAYLTGGEYTHAELVFSDGLVGSAWFDEPGLKNGVHLQKAKGYDPKLWELVPIRGDEPQARNWFEEHVGQDYSLIGAIGNVIRPLRGSERKFFCSQTVAAALGWKDPWRFDPNLLHCVVTGVANIPDNATAQIRQVQAVGFRKGKAVSDQGVHGHEYVLEDFRPAQPSYLNDYRICVDQDLSPEQQTALQSLLDVADQDPIFVSGPCERPRPRQVVIDDRTGVVVGCFEPRETVQGGVTWYRTNRPYVVPAYRGRGIMRHVLSHWYQDRQPAVAWIRDDNRASIALFQSLGFKPEWAMPVGPDDTPGHEYILKAGTRVALEQVADDDPASGAVQELETSLDSVSEKVRRNVTVVTPTDLDCGYLLHISSDTNIRSFVPLIGRRQAPSEDRTVPRVCVCPHLLGCILGYSQAVDDFHAGTTADAKGKLESKGGWKIYGFHYEAALKPNSKLVYDALATDELWLTAYNPTTAEYKPVEMGKAFVRSIRYVARSGKHPVSDMELCVEVKHSAGLRFSKNIFLDQGYWVLEGPTESHVASWRSDREFVARKLTRAEYYSAKAASADLLSLPASLLW